MGQHLEVIVYWEWSRMNFTFIFLKKISSQIRQDFLSDSSLPMEIPSCMGLYDIPT